MMLLSMTDEGCDDVVSEKSEVNTKSEAHRKVLEYIGRRYEIYLTDGRIIRGTMLATDKDANMVFNQADERWNQSTTAGVRFLGQATISKKYVAKMLHLDEPKINPIIGVTPEKPKKVEPVESVKEETDDKK
uniref:Sm domain-containing protein n=1 Tax=Caenorhabditis tropicalis TaxID=1561998 RepID=A0A1I7TEE5_9PELO